ncbi:MAG TPA: hypothetical protein VHF51_02565 [Solirubrobacteraceae bacterium]|nr:hypothetical protein [Solirubrobacteraceae bacterium]
MLLLPLAGSASAAPAAEKVFPANQNGVTEPSGLAVTPDGAVWASDALLGVCKLDLKAGALVRDKYCAPEFEEGAPVDGIELPPPNPERPAAAFQIAFDSNGCTTTTPPTERQLCNFYVAEGSSGGSGVWRMHWNSETRAIDEATKIYEDNLDQRIMGLALAPDGAVDFAAKRNSEILRIKNAATATLASGTTSVGFTSTGEQATSIANLAGKTYLVEGGQLSVIEQLGRTARPLANPAAGAVASAVLADAEGNLFVGTSRSTLTDEVLTLRDGAYLPGAYDRGFANVTAMAFSPDGDLYVAHDPFAALSPGVDMPGAGEVFLRAKTTPNPPDVNFTKQPAAVVKSGSLRFEFAASTAPAAASFDCRVDGGNPFRCDSGVYETNALGEGAHSLTVRAANGTTPVAGDWGVAKQVGFTIDDTKPVVEIDPRTATTAIGGNLRLLFSASDKTPMAFTCRVDDGDEFGCGPGDDLLLPLGPHKVTVFATDSAGNVSDTAEWDVTAVPAPPVPLVTPPAGVATVPAAPGPAKPVVAPATTRTPRIDIHVPCVAVSQSRRERARYAISGRRAVLTYRAPAKARFAKFTLRRAAGGRRDVPIVETLGYARVRRAGAHRSRVALTAGQRRHVRSGRMRLAVAYGTCRTQVGRWQWIAASATDQEGRR